MTSNKAKIILVFILFVLLFGILPLLYWDFIRDTIVVPIYYVIWVISLFLKSIPQGVYFAFLVFLSLIIGFKTLESVQVERRFKRLERDRPEATTQYLRWKSLCANMDINPFSRNRFAWEAKKLILSILACEQGMDIADAEALVLDDTLDVPDVIRKLIETNTLPDAKLPLNRITSAMLRVRRLLFKVGAKNDLKIDSPVAEIIGFIEHHLEINHAGNQPESWN
jgi:hypothetical protein